MKHILLISILIFSFFLVSCEKKSRVLYLWEEPSGGVWKSYGDDDTQLKYNGEIKHGKPYGVGVMEHPVIGNYVGERENSRYHGQGTLTFRDGDKYVGRFYHGEKHGQGTYTNPDGIKYVGEFKHGRDWNTTEYNKNGNVTGKYVNGIYIKQ